MEEAIRETENLNDGEVFLVKDLFKGYVWNRIPRKDRLLLGTLFLNHVSKMNGNLKAIEKTSSTVIGISTATVQFAETATR